MTLANENTATQCAEILAYLQTGQGITQKESIEKIGSYRLASRINDLKKRGHEIVAVRENVINRHGRKTYIHRYFLAEYAEPQPVKPLHKCLKTKRLQAALESLPPNHPAQEMMKDNENSLLFMAFLIASGLAKPPKKS